MISDFRRQEIQSYMTSVEKAAEYLDMAERTIVLVHKRADGAPKYQSLLKLKDILRSFIEILNENVSTLSSDISKFVELKDRARDYMAQVETPPDDYFHQQTVLPGAELDLAEEEAHTYNIITQPMENRVLAIKLDE